MFAGDQIQVPRQGHGIRANSCALSCVTRELASITKTLLEASISNGSASVWCPFPVNIQTTLIYNTSIAFLCHIFYFAFLFFIFLLYFLYLFLLIYIYVFSSSIFYFVLFILYAFYIYYIYSIFVFVPRGFFIFFLISMQHVIT